MIAGDSLVRKEALKLSSTIMHPKSEDVTFVTIDLYLSVMQFLPLFFLSNDFI